MADRRERTVRRILDGAARAFAKAGFAATSMEEIAASAGVSRLLLYRDFAGKRDLYQAVLERAATAIQTGVPPQISNESLWSLISLARADPDGFTLLFRHAAREPEFASYVSAHHESSVREAERQLRPIEPDRLMRRWAAETAVSTTYEAILNWLEHGDASRDHDFFQRLLAVNRAIAKPLGGRA